MSLNFRKAAAAQPELYPASMSDFNVGTAFFEGNQIRRGIWADEAQQTRELLASGLIRRLEREGLFPQTAVAKDSLPGFALTIEHERLHPLVLPSEWSWTMLRDATLALLEVNRIARTFGYETKGPHLHNLSFKGTQPIYFDLGSFVRVEQTSQGWSGYDEFIRSVKYPLTLRRNGGSLINRVLSDYCAESQIGHEEFIQLRLGELARWLPRKLFARGLETHQKLLSIGSWSEQKLNDPHRSRFKRALLNTLRRIPFLQSLTADFARLQKGIRRMPEPWFASNWYEYDQGISLDKDGNVLLDKRLQRILELVSKLKAQSVVDLGGNRGQFGLALHKSGAVPKIITTDKDARVVDSAYNMFRRQAPACSVAVVDLLEENRSVKVPPVAERYRADAVLALALTHHLILSQGVDGVLLMRRMAAFCTRYAVMEFMPLGLWDGRSAPPVPSWYTVDWFREHFVQRFDLLHEESVEENRIVFIGKKRAGVH